MAELKKIIVDGVEHTLPEGGSGGNSDHIIEVENLPTENIDGSAIYKLHTLNIYIATTEDIMLFEHMFGTPTFTVIVDTLPATGETVTQADKVILYYSKEANAIYGYLDDETASSLGGPAGWYPADMLLTALLPNSSYAGIFSSFNDITIQGEGTFICAAWVYLFYVYKDGQFNNFEPDLPIYRGEGKGSVIFSDPFWSSASGAAAVALGNETRASGYCSLAGGFGTYVQGQYSFAFGLNSTAGGDYAHAEGSSTNAGGKASHAEGQQTTASGNCSHAEGHSTQATTTSAHAEGFNTRATHIASHAEGEDTIASGSHSHSEGYGTTASGKTQHVQGRYNITDANNKYAHIVGNGTGPGITGTTGDINRSNAHTLDWSGNAWFKGNVRVGGTSWDDATELGSGGVSSVFEDVTALPDNPDGQKIYRVRESQPHWYIYESGELVNYGELMEEQAGATINIIQVSELPENPETFVNLETMTVNFYLMGEDLYGYDTSTGSNGWLSNTELFITYELSAGYGGVITSLDTTNLTDGYSYIYSINSHSYINVNGDLQFKFANLSELEDNLGVGRSGTGAYAEVFNAYTYNKASGVAAHAEGIETTASNQSSHAEGNNTTASGSSSHAEGQGTTAHGDYSHAEGHGAVIANKYTFTRTATRYQYTCNSILYFSLGDVFTNNNGTYTKITAVSGTGSSSTYTFDKDFVTTEGETVDLYNVVGVALGDSSHAEGHHTIASGFCSHAEGQETIASGGGSHAEGNRTIASDEDSHAEGDRTTASGFCSHAEGKETTASGSRSHAEGTSTIASGNGSHAEGYATIAASENQHAQGKYNIEDSSGTYAHIVGNGSSSYNRSNAHTLDWDGNAWFKGKVRVGGDNWATATELSSEFKYIFKETVTIDSMANVYNINLSNLTNLSSYSELKINLSYTSGGNPVLENIICQNKTQITIDTVTLVYFKGVASLGIINIQPRIVDSGVSGLTISFSENGESAVIPNSTYVFTFYGK